jgi:hypothetical protein
VDDNKVQPLEADVHPLGTGVIKLPESSFTQIETNMGPAQDQTFMLASQ